MPTNTAGSVARYDHSQTIHYLRADFTFADDGVRKTVGIIPAGAVILKPASGGAIHTAFDGTTTFVVGKSSPVDDDDFFLTAGATTVTTFVPFNTNVNEKVAADTTITATFSGGTVTVGNASVIIAYVPANDSGNTLT